MKNNKLKSFILFSQAVITLSVLLASCDNFFMPEAKIVKAPQNFDSPTMSRKSELALWHTAETHETSVEALQEHVQAWLQPDTSSE